MVFENGRITSFERAGDRARAKADARPAESFVVGLAATAVGAGLVGLAVRNSLVRYGVVGVLVAAAGLWLVNERVRGWVERWPGPFLGWSLFTVLAGGAAMAWAFARNDAWLAGVALVLLVGGLLPAGALLRRATRRGWIWGVPVGFLTGLAAAVLPSRRLGLLAGVAGVALYRRGLRRALEEEKFAVPATWAGVGLTAVGSSSMVVASRASSSYAAFAAAVLLAFGVIAMSEGWPRLGLRPIPPAALAVVGLVVFVIGAYTLLSPRLKLPFWPGLAVAGVIWLIGASFVLRGEGVIFVVLLGLASVWLLVDRSDESSSDPRPMATARILALGDSYISGEGSPSFFEGTNVKGTNKNECRRSPAAFPYLVAEKLDMALDFFACSGAKADQLHLSGQERTSPPGVVGGLPQLDNLPADVSNIKVVLVSIGGNDALFGEVGKGCALPGSCDALREVWLANLDQIGPKITTAYEAVKARLPGVPVVAVPYPLMLTERSCGWSVLHDGEHEFLSEFVTVLNDRIRVSAANAGVNFFDPQLFAYEGGKICDGAGPDDTFMNFVSFNPVEGSFFERINPRNWIHGSLHPRPTGHARTAEVLAPWLRELLAGVSAGREPNPAPDPGARFRLRNVGSARPLLARPVGLPADLGCPDTGQSVSPFASSVLLFDARSPFVLDADPGSPVCLTREDGSWQRVLPGEDAPDVTFEDRTVRVRPRVPPSGPQQIVYDNTELGWHLRTVRFCSAEQDCPSNVTAFVNGQLADAAREVALPVLLLFLSGWLTAIGLTRRSLIEDVARGVA